MAFWFQINEKHQSKRMVKDAIKGMYEERHLDGKDPPTERKHLQNGNVYWQGKTLATENTINEAKYGYRCERRRICSG